MNESKENILKSAFYLFLHNNYEGVSMRDILNKVGLSRGAFYHYFESKQACFEECVKYYLTQVTHPEPADYTGITFKMFMEDNLKRLANMVDMVNVPNKLLFYTDVIRIIPDFKEFLERRNEEEVAVWAKVAKHAIKTGEIRGDIPAEEIAALFITQADGIFVMGSATMMDYDRGYAEVVKQWNNLYSLIKKSKG